MNLLAFVFPSTAHAIAFVTASLVLAIAPGPAVFFIVTRSLTLGRAHGLASVFGVALGNFFNAVAAALGLAALFAVSHAALVVVQWLGAAYLVWLGISTLAAGKNAGVAPPGGPPSDRPALWKVFRDGAVVALFNPKTTLFFAAFVPQFLGPLVPGHNPFGQTVVLGAIFVAIASITDCLYAVTAGTLSGALRRAGQLSRIGRWLSALAYFGLAAVALIGPPRPRHG